MFKSNEKLHDCIDMILHSEWREMPEIMNEVKVIGRDNRLHFVWSQKGGLQLVSIHSVFTKQSGTLVLLVMI